MGSSDGYITFRTATSTDDTELTATTQKTAPDVSDDGTIALSPQRGMMEVIFFGTDAADETFSWTIWAYKSASDPAEYIANGTGILGATTEGTTDTYYADTIVITAQSWLRTVSVVAGAPDAIVSGGGIAKLIFDSCEYQYFNIIITVSTCDTTGARYANYY